MTSRIRAITEYRPRVKQGKPTDQDRYMQLLTQRTTLSAGVVKNVQESEIETIIGLLTSPKPTVRSVLREMRPSRGLASVAPTIW